MQLLHHLYENYCPEPLSLINLEYAPLIKSTVICVLTIGSIHITNLLHIQHLYIIFGSIIQKVHVPKVNIFIVASAFIL